MFKKTGGNRSNLRKKVVDLESDDEAGNSAPAPPISRSLLSFGEDIDNESEFKIKKPSKSKRMEKFRKQIEKDRVKSCEELSTVLDSSPPRLKEESVAQPNKIELAEPTPTPAARSPLNPTLRGGEIPDANVVFLARKQRARAREEGDIMPISDDTQKYKKENSKCRLVREDDENDPSDDEDHGKFYSHKANIKDKEEQRKMLHAQFLQVEQGVLDTEDEADEEFDKWEMEQIKKVVSGQKIATIQQEYNRTSNYMSEWNLRPEVREPQPMELDMQIDADSYELITKTNKNLPKFGGGTMSELSKGVSLTQHLAKLRLQLDEGEEFERSKNLEMEKLRNHLEENNESKRKLEEIVPNCSTQYNLFQDMNIYCRDLLECLNEKVPEIDRIESEYVTLLKGRTEFVLKRHRQDIKDEFESCSMSAERRAVLGSDAVKIMRAADREARRTRRRQAREKETNSCLHRDGDSSDDEFVPSHIVAFNQQSQQLVTCANEVMLDVNDDFSSLTVVLSYFCRWWTEDRTSFEEAYINLCVQKLIAPLIRLQMISWNPFEDNCKCLDLFDWFRDLLLFLPMESAVDANDAEPIVELIPLVVEKVVVPKLTVLVESVWNPTSTRQSARLSQLLKSLLQYPTVTQSSKQVQKLLNVIQTKVKMSLDEDLFMPIYSKETIMSSLTGAKAFVYRQYWFAMKVMVNVIGLEGFVSSALVQELTLDGIVNRQLVLALQSVDQTQPQVLTMAKALVHNIPSIWYGDKPGSVKKQFEPLAKVLYAIGESGGKDAAKQAHKMLLSLKANQYAYRLSDKGGLKI